MAPKLASRLSVTHSLTQVLICPQQPPPTAHTATHTMSRAEKTAIVVSKVMLLGINWDYAL